MSLANMREHGVRSVEATCEACTHEAIISVDNLPGDTYVNIKIAAVSAVLSGLIVGICDGDARTSPAASPKTFVDRVPETAIETGAGNGLMSGEARRPFQSAGIKGDRTPVGASTCNNAAWPYIPEDCLHLTGLGPRAGVRVITVETREGENTSILMRMPQTTVATR